MSATKHRIGVVGAGKMGELHLRKLVELSDRVDIVGIYDSDIARAAQIQQQYRVPRAEKLEELLFDADAIVIATPTSTHAAVAKLALDAGVDLLIEKPIASTPAEGEELTALAERQGRILQVGLLERFRFRALSQSLALHPVRYVEAQRLSASLGRDVNIDVVTDLMIHDLDLALSLVREDPSSISAIGVEVLTDRCDMASVRLEFPSGQVVNLSASRVSRAPLRKFRVVSEDAYASFDFVTNSVSIHRRGEGMNIDSEMLEQPGLDALKEQWTHFLGCIERRETPLVSGRDGVRALHCAIRIGEEIAARAKLARGRAKDSRAPSTLGSSH